MKNDKQEYILEKNVWTHDDFEIMGWHDAHIHGFVIEKPEEQFSGNLLFDLVYAFRSQRYFYLW